MAMVKRLLEAGADANVRNKASTCFFVFISTVSLILRSGVLPFEIAVSQDVKAEIKRGMPLFTFKVLFLSILVTTMSPKRKVLPDSDDEDQNPEEEKRRKELVEKMKHEFSRMVDIREGGIH